MVLTCGWTMLCKQCGFGLGNKANFCPSCGQKISEKERDEGKFQKNPARWLKILFGFLLAGLLISCLIILFSDDISETVSEQLQAIKEQRITEAYYAFTSKEFQKATSLGEFQEFMNVYPVFSHNKSVRFIERHVESDLGTLQAMILTDQGMEIPVRYQLIRDNDKWLISSIKLEEESPAGDTKDIVDLKAKNEVFDSKPLTDAIEGMMLQIRNNNAKNAYEMYTSADFRKNTNLEEFVWFLKENPSFAENESLDLGDLTFDNNVATMNATLKDGKGNLHTAEYDLVQEKGEWKIFHAKVWKFDPKSKEAAAKLVFSKFILGSEVDSNNVVTSPRSVFKSNDGDIYLNLYADNVQAGTKIEVTFEHVDTHSTIAPVSKRVMEQGDIILSFIFTPPEKGWPTGNYRLLATSSNGEKSSYDFKVEE